MGQASRDWRVWVAVLSTVFLILSIILMCLRHLHKTQRRKYAERQAASKAIQQKSSVYRGIPTPAYTRGSVSIKSFNEVRGRGMSDSHSTAKNDDKSSSSVRNSGSNIVRTSEEIPTRRPSTCSRDSVLSRYSGETIEGRDSYRKSRDTFSRLSMTLEIIQEYDEKLSEIENQVNMNPSVADNKK